MFVGVDSLDFAKIIKVILKLMLHMKKEDWVGLLSLLGCFGIVMTALFILSIVNLIISGVLALILSIFNIDYQFELLMGIPATVVPVVLFILHIYKGYKDGFYSKGN